MNGPPAIWLQTVAFHRGLRLDSRQAVRASTPELRMMPVPSPTFANLKGKIAVGSHKGLLWKAHFDLNQGRRLHRGVTARRAGLPAPLAVALISEVRFGSKGEILTASK